ncbi:MAG TPA: hypothetical protein DE045_01725 [Oceanospirillaceae bacterium]|nr:hypothetical protein [Oceanospirillaceae bacterium]
MDLHLLQHPKTTHHISSAEYLQVELLMLYGESCDIGQGKHYTSLTKRGYKRLLKDIHHVQQHLKTLRSTYLIDADGDTLVTVGQRYNGRPSTGGALRASH